MMANVAESEFVERIGADDVIHAERSLRKERRSGSGVKNLPNTCPHEKKPAKAGLLVS
jgi:hypothetical protein